MIPIVLGLSTLIAKVAAVAALPRAARALRELARPVEAPSGPPREEASSPQHGAKPLTLSKFPATGEGSVEYAYNKRRELSHSYRKVNHEGTTETSYRYDQNHNRVKKNETRYSSNANDQLTSVRRPNQSLAYNAAGQAIQAGSSAFTFAYNDQIKSVRNGPNSATYLYDGNGQRVQKTVDGVVSKFLWAGSEIIKEYTAGGQVKAQYLLGAERTAIKTNGRWNFYLSDGLGSTVMLTDYRGRSVATWDYDDFGETTQLSGSPSVYNPFLYTGQELDKETGFYHLRARHYAPSLGKFLSRDPIGYAGGANLYSYCAGDPINYVDPSGLNPGAVGLALLYLSVEGWRHATGEAQADRMWAEASAREILPGHKIISGGAAVEGFPNELLVAPLLVKPVLNVGKGTIPGGRAGTLGGNRRGGMPGSRGPCYKISSQLEKHMTGDTTQGKSQFLYSVEPKATVLSAAEYADKHGLWRDNKAIVTTKGPVGVYAKTGELSNAIKLYRTNDFNGTRYVHGAPGRPGSGL